MRWVALVLFYGFLLALAAADAGAQTNEIYPYAAGSDTTFTGFAYVPRTFDLTKSMPIFEKLVTAVPDTIPVIGWSYCSIVGDGDVTHWVFKNGLPTLAVDRPDTLIVTSLGDGTYVLVTGR